MTDPSAPSWTWPRLRLRPALALLGVFALAGLWLGATVYLAGFGEGGRPSLARAMATELTGLLACYLLLPVPLAAVGNAPGPWGRWGRFLAFHGLGYALCALLVPALFIPARRALFPLLGLGEYHYGPLATQLPMEWMKLLVGYLVAAGAFAFYGHLREARARALREAELHARLQEARVQALAAQLDPHFLFNALNTVSAVMHEDLRHSDRLLASLGRMLRDGLSGEEPWTLARELAHLEAYLDFALARFGEGLRVEVQAEPGLGGVAVPRYGLQRLVENALKHNPERQDRPLTVRVAVGMREGRMMLEVADDGVGFLDPARALEGPGLGLRNLQEGLALQQGSGARLDILNRPGGGACVRIWLEAARG